jgi:regulator of cell morphogenesis and NO signaling
MTTTTFTERTVGELAVENPNSIRVFENWKIDYCCGGRTPLAEACAAAGKTVAEFEAALSSMAQVPELGAKQWGGESLSAIATHICKTYHAWTREELLTLDPLAEKVNGVHGHRRAELAEVITLVRALSDDMLPHMLKEEQVLFPYVDSLERGNAQTPFFGTVKNPVRMMMLEHDRVGELMARLRVITGGFEAPEDACFSYRTLYSRLAEFETKTHEHIHLENNLYFPRAVELEEKAGKPAAFAPAGAQGHACGCGGH